MHAVGNLIRARNPDARVAYVHSERFVSDMVRALQHNTINEFKHDLPHARRAADRRHPVLRRQGPLAGRVLPHLQRAARRPAADHPDLRPLSEGSRGPRGAAEVALRLGPDGGDRAAGARNLRRDPDEQGRGRRRRACRKKSRSSSPSASAPTCASSKARCAAWSPTRSSPAARSRWSSRRKRCATCCALQERLVTIENIQKTVAEYYKIRVADLLSKRRSRSIARPRQVAMALAKELTESQPAGDRRCLRRPRSHDRAARLPRDQGAARDADADERGLSQPVENPDWMMWISCG